MASPLGTPDNAWTLAGSGTRAPFIGPTSFNVVGTVADDGSGAAQFTGDGSYLIAPALNSFPAAFTIAAQINIAALANGTSLLGWGDWGTRDGGFLIQVTGGKVRPVTIVDGNYWYVVDENGNGIDASKVRPGRNLLTFRHKPHGGGGGEFHLTIGDQRVQRAYGVGSTYNQPGSITTPGLYWGVRINGSTASESAVMLLQDAYLWFAWKEDEDVLALMDTREANTTRRILPYSQWETDYLARDGGIPGVKYDQKIFSGRQQNVSARFRNAIPSGSTDTARKILVANRIAVKPVAKLANYFVILDGRPGEEKPPIDQQVGMTNKVGSGAVIDSALVAATIDGAGSAHLAWQDVKDALLASPTVVFRGDRVPVNVVHTMDGGYGYVPGAIFLDQTNPLVEGTHTGGGDAQLDATASDFAVAQALQWGALIGLWGCPTGESGVAHQATYMHVGDSNEDPTVSLLNYESRMAEAEDWNYHLIARVNEAWSDWARAGSATARRIILATFPRVVFALGTNDAILADTLVNIKGYITPIVLQCAQGNTRQIMFQAPPPISAAPGNTANSVTAIRNALCSFLAGLNSATASAFFGLNVLFYLYDPGTDRMVAQDTRGAGATNVNVDIGYTNAHLKNMEQGWPAVTGLWVNANLTNENGNLSGNLTHETDAASGTMATDNLPSRQAWFLQSLPSPPAPVISGTPSIDTTGAVLTADFTVANAPLLPSGTAATGLALSGGHTLGTGTRTSATQYTFPISPVVTQGEVVTLSATGSNITDSAPTALANFSGHAVTNGSTVSAGSHYHPDKATADALVDRLRGVRKGALIGQSRQVLSAQLSQVIADLVAALGVAS